MKKFFERLFHPERAKQKYLDQFKKEYQDRTLTENVLADCLFNYEYCYDSTNTTHSVRYLGCIEGILLAEKVWVPGIPFEYLKGETYPEYVIRAAKDYLKNSGVL